MAKYRDDLDLDLIFKHYDRKEVLDELTRLSENKESVGSYGGKGYAKRPDTLIYPQDIIAQVKKGITSFHFSEETWRDPLLLRTGMVRKDQDALRIGWDLILDIDCKFFEYSQIASHLVVQALQYYDIESISVKFSGNNGFHIAVPFESMPKFINGKPTESLFPEAPRKIAELIKHRIQPEGEPGLLSREILEYERKQTNESKTDEELLHFIAEKTEHDFEELTSDLVDQFQNKVKVFNAFALLDVDTVLITSRHLCRMPYSVNEKSGLVSIPINPEKIMQFTKDVAKVENLVFSKFVFLDRTTAHENEAQKLLQSAYDFSVETTGSDDADGKKPTREFSQLDEAIPEELFPPSITHLLAGNMRDGKKRAIFALGAFLTHVGWGKNAIEERIEAWNKTHPEPLTQSYLTGQFRHLHQSRPLPPNFTTIKEYCGIDISDEELRFKNPLAFAKAKYDLTKKTESKKPKLTEKEKLARKRFRDKQKAESFVEK